MTLKPTMVQLPAELVELLDVYAQAAGVSRSQVVRDAIAAYLDAGAAGEARLADRYAEAYERYPLDTPDEWGDLDSWLRGLEDARASEVAEREAW